MLTEQFTAQYNHVTQARNLQVWILRRLFGIFSDKHWENWCLVWGGKQMVRITDGYLPGAILKPHTYYHFMIGA